MLRMSLVNTYRLTPLHWNQEAKMVKLQYIHIRSSLRLVVCMAVIRILISNNKFDTQNDGVYITEIIDAISD